MIQSSKEILKEFNLAIKHFRNAVKMAKKNLIIGEVTFQTSSKAGRPKKIKNVIPDADANKESL